MRYFGLFFILFLAVPGTLQCEEIRYRITNDRYETPMRPDPDSFRAVGRIPVKTKVEVLDEAFIDQGKAQVKWYKVSYEGKTGWVSGMSFDDGINDVSFSQTHSDPGSSARSSLTGFEL